MTVATRPLDVAEVRALLVRAVEEKGADYVYVDPEGKTPGTGDIELNCVNMVDAQTPSCIAGHVWTYLGYGVDILDRGINESSAWGVAATLGIVDPDIEIADQYPVWLRALTAAQKAQDDGLAWGDALAAFDAAVAS